MDTQLWEKLIDKISQWNREWFVYNTGRADNMPLTKEQFINILKSQFKIDSYDKLQ